MSDKTHTRIEQVLTEPGIQPDGDGWQCIHSSCSPDGTRWWLWQRVVHA